MILPTPLDLKRRLPLTLRAHQNLKASRHQAAAIVSHHSPLFVIFMGPCSIHDRESALEYGKRLRSLSEKVRNCFLIMRVFCEKPRTVTGWKGFVYDPHLDGSNDIASGLYQTRRLFLDLVELGVPCSTEFVDPLTAPYIEDLVSWGVIGARSSASQPHRQLASSFDFPIGFKNSLDGDVLPAINGVIAMNHAHDFLGIDEEGKISVIRSTGNPLGHIILRGSYSHVNYTPQEIAKACEELLKKQVSPRLIIDCSHGNSQQQPFKQAEVFRSLLSQRNQGNENIFGAMLESHLVAGSQRIDRELLYGVSLTDPCIDWELTEELVLWADEEISSSLTSIRFTHN